MTLFILTNYFIKLDEDVYSFSKLIIKMFKQNSVIIYVKNVNISTNLKSRLFGQDPIDTPIETYPRFAVFSNDDFVLGF